MPFACTLPYQLEVPPAWQPSDQQVSVSSTKQMGYPCRHGGKIWRTRSEEAAAEAKKAEGASCTALRIPGPPNFTGKDACVHPGCPLVKGKLKAGTHDGPELFII